MYSQVLNRPQSGKKICTRLENDNSDGGRATEICPNIRKGYLYLAIRPRKFIICQMPLLFSGRVNYFPLCGLFGTSEYVPQYSMTEFTVHQSL